MFVKIVLRNKEEIEEMKDVLQVEIENHGYKEKEIIIKSM